MIDQAPLEFTLPHRLSHLEKVMEGYFIVWMARLGCSGGGGSGLKYKKCCGR
ncbi:SEC-C metal-binding domain-containing protein [Methanoculleus taiwanensis]|uniref:SEC-C metal-binding domain-containing protein n=1 Tax=Methanoculleus taiwanensis TaxID=1550565 RepID=UPI0019D4604D|nr:SEC-C metal-binding domain-containing protein [Methanoculleus taiwanensis]